MGYVYTFTRDTPANTRNGIRRDAARRRIVCQRSWPEARTTSTLDPELSQLCAMNIPAVRSLGPTVSCSLGRLWSSLNLLTCRVTPAVCPLGRATVNRTDFLATVPSQYQISTRLYSGIVSRSHYSLNRERKRVTIRPRDRWEMKGNKIIAKLARRARTRSKD